MTHPHLEGLIRKWRRLSRHEDEHGELEVGEESAIRLRLCADELEAALAALPGGGVDGQVTIVTTLRTCSCHAERDRELCLNKHQCVKAFALGAPTPPPHEADRNGRGHE